MSPETAIYRTKQGDVLDLICLAHYGAASGFVESVLLANPGLAGRGVVYDEGISITLPVLAPQAARLTRLYD